MFARLAFLVVCLGLIGASLLALRQARLQAASEAAQAQLRIASADEELFSLRAQVAATVTPSAVEKLASSMHPMHPATNDIPTQLAMDELKGLPEAMGGVPQIERMVQPKLPANAKTDANSGIYSGTKSGTSSGTRKSTPTPSKKPSSPRVARGN